MNVVFFGTRYEAETGGFFGSLVAVDNHGEPLARADWADVFSALAAGQSVNIRPACSGELAFANECLARYQATIYMADDEAFAEGVPTQSQQE